MGKMLVYHGSYTEVQQPRIIVARNTKDFGTGFYCTVIKEQAERWAKRYATPVVNIYSLLINEKLDILEFKEMTDFLHSMQLPAAAEAALKNDIISPPEKP